MEVVIFAPPVPNSYISLIGDIVSNHFLFKGLVFLKHTV